MWASTSSIAWGTADGKVLYAASQHMDRTSPVAMTVDAGVTWKFVTSGLPKVPVQSLLVDSADASGLSLYAGTWYTQ